MADPVAATVEVFSAGEKGWLLAGVYGPEDSLASLLLPGFNAPGAAIFRRPQGL